MKRLLLDTHALLWWLTAPQKLRRSAHGEIGDIANEVCVSPVSGWEIAIKHALGKLQAPDNLEASILRQGFEPMLLTFAHAARAGALPRHHGDPFDRMLVAQAQAEGLTLVTRDSHLARYHVATMAA